MFLRATIVAGSAAALLALTGGGTAHASCLDDFQATDFEQGYTQTPKSSQWSSGYVHQSGTATVFVYGDALISDWTEYAATDLPNYTETYSGNVVAATTEFVDCVAG